MPWEQFGDRLLNVLGLTVADDDEKSTYTRADGILYENE